MSKITNIDELKIAVEDAAEAKIFEHVWMASEQAKEEAFAKGLSIVVLEGNQIVEISPDGVTKKVLKTLDLNHVQVENLFVDKDVVRKASGRSSREMLRRKLALKLYQRENNFDDRTVALKVTLDDKSQKMRTTPDIKPETKIKFTKDGD